MKISMPSTGVRLLVVVSFCCRKYHGLEFNPLDGHVVVFQTSARADKLETRRVSGYTWDEKWKMILSSDELIWPRIQGKEGFKAHEKELFS